MSTFEGDCAKLYNPLPSRGDSVRLLRLCAGSGADALRAKLEVHDLQSWPVYECVSYTWGDAANCESITVKGVDLTIRKHLWEILSLLRLRQQDRMLWVDALCISQSSTAEKNSQVSKIGRIFSRASKVLVWLGRNVDDSEPLLSMIMAKDNQPLISVATSPLHDQLRFVRSTLSFLSRPYWRRTWILQEYLISLNLEFHCENIYFSEELFDRKWSVVKDVLSQLISSADDDTLVSQSKLGYALATERVFSDALSRRRRLTLTGDSHVHFHYTELLSLLRVSECSDIRDKLYSCMHLLFDNDPLKSITIDYNTTFHEMFVEAITAADTNNIYPYYSNCLDLCYQLLVAFRLDLDEIVETFLREDADKLDGTGEALASRFRVQAHSTTGWVTSALQIEIGHAEHLIAVRRSDEGGVRRRVQLTPEAEEQELWRAPTWTKEGSVIWAPLGLVSVSVGICFQQGSANDLSSASIILRGDDNHGPLLKALPFWRAYAKYCTDISLSMEDTPSGRGSMLVMGLSLPHIMIIAGLYSLLYKDRIVA